MRWLNEVIVKTVPLSSSNRSLFRTLTPLRSEALYRTVFGEPLRSSTLVAEIEQLTRSLALPRY